MRLIRTAKSAANRVDHAYIRHPRRAGIVLAATTILLVAAAVGAWQLNRQMGDRMIYSPGPVCAVHAQFNNNCEACHDRGKGFREPVEDSACLKCHDAAVHDSNQKALVAERKAEPLSGDLNPTLGDSKLPQEKLSDAGAPLDEVLNDLQLRSKVAIKVDWDALSFKAKTPVKVPAVGTTLDDALKAMLSPLSEDSMKIEYAALNNAIVVSTGHRHLWRSSNCMVCHTEHRGHEALTSRGNQTCLHCHEDVTRHSTNPPRIMPKVTAFATSNHPAFGRDLTDSKRWSTEPQPLRDPTPFIFSHKEHQGLVLPLAGETENCSACHQLAPSSTPAGGQGPDQRYMQPVSYEMHCAKCHPMSVIDNTDTPVPHEKLATIRPLLREYAGRADKYRQMLAAMSPEEKKQALSVTVKGTGPRPKPRVVQISEDDWIASKSPLSAAMKDWFEKNAADKTPANLNSPEAVEYVATHSLAKTDNKCGLCHELSDNVDKVRALREMAGPPMAQSAINGYRAWPGGASPTSAPSQPTTAPSPVEPLNTLATGIGTSPRRWFRHSIFNHDAHRAVDCLACHAQALASDTMSDVLLPKLEDCVACHHKPTVDNAGAGDNCMMCHVYHNRSLEVPVDTRSVVAFMEAKPTLAPPPATQPAAAPATQPGAMAQ